MTIIDANLLVYAYTESDARHPRASEWLEDLLSGDEIVAIPWISIWAFIRVMTNSRLWAQPVDVARAFGTVRKWLGRSQAIVLNPGARHLDLLHGLVEATGATGPRLTDAVLAALAIEHDATLASADRDFARFPGLRWVNPLAQA